MAQPFEKLSKFISCLAWWRHQMETPMNSPHKGQWRGASFFFDLRLIKRLSKQSRRRWFETPSRSLWRHCNVYRFQIERQMKLDMMQWRLWTWMVTGISSSFTQWKYEQIFLYFLSTKYAYIYIYIVCVLCACVHIVYHSIDAPLPSVAYMG